MDVSLLIPIAVQCDIKTTRALACVCSLFKNMNIWRLKFNLEFPDCQYIKTWSPITNYVIQKKNNFSILIHKENVIVDNILYENCPIYYHLNRVLDYHTKQEFGCSIMQFVKISVKNRYLILYEYERVQWGDIIIYTTKEEKATKIANDLHNIAISNNSHNFDLVIIDLDKMLPYFIGQSTVASNFEQCYRLFTND
jgi:hypothetical protein